VQNFTLTFSAVTDHDKNVQFHSTPGNSAISSLTMHSFEFLNEWEVVDVPGRKLDTLANMLGWKEIALVKIDVEGHEMDVLRGAREVLSGRKPVVIFEFTPSAKSIFGWQDEDFVSLLSGYTPFDFDALVEPPLYGIDIPMRRVCFPLPDGMNEQVNVFATPKS
jgi:hypothetical protein